MLARRAGSRSLAAARGGCGARLDAERGWPRRPRPASCDLASERARTMQYGAPRSRAARAPVAGRARAADRDLVGRGWRRRAAPTARAALRRAAREAEEARPPPRRRGAHTRARSLALPRRCARAARSARAGGGAARPSRRGGRRKLRAQVDGFGSRVEVPLRRECRRAASTVDLQSADESRPRVVVAPARARAAGAAAGAARRSRTARRPPSDLHAAGPPRRPRVASASPGRLPGAPPAARSLAAPRNTVAASRPRAHGRRQATGRRRGVATSAAAPPRRGADPCCIASCRGVRAAAIAMCGARARRALRRRRRRKCRPGRLDQGRSPACSLVQRGDRVASSPASLAAKTREGAPTGSTRPRLRVEASARPCKARRVAPADGHPHLADGSSPSCRSLSPSDAFVGGDVGARGARPRRPHGAGSPTFRPARCATPRWTPKRRCGRRQRLHRASDRVEHVRRLNARQTTTNVCRPTRATPTSSRPSDSSAARKAAQPGLLARPPQPGGRADPVGETRVDRRRARCGASCLLPHDADAYFGLRVALRAQERNGDARSARSRIGAVDQARTTPTAWSNPRRRSRRRSGGRRSSRRTSALGRLPPDDVKAWLNLAISYTGTDQMEESEGAFRSAAEASRRPTRGLAAQPRAAAHRLPRPALAARRILHGGGDQPAALRGGEARSCRDGARAVRRFSPRRRPTSSRRRG